MAKWYPIYLLISLLLIGLAIYEHVNSASLSLPISPPLTIITAILPFLAALNVIYYGSLVRSVDATTRRKFFGIALQALQAIVTTVLATLFFSNVVPSPIRRCMLSTTWQRLFSAHDAESIRRIQDTLNCCGFNTVRDKAWPFEGHRPSERQCSEIYERTTPCSEPWGMALQRNSGLEFGVLLAVGLSQIMNLIVFEIIRSWYGNRRSLMESFRYGASSDSERARLLSGDDDEPSNAAEGARLLPTGEPDQSEQTEPSNGRGANQTYGNPWQGE